MEVKEAYHNRNIALKEFKFRKHPNKAAARAALRKVMKTTEDLIQAIADKRSYPPAPVSSFNYEGFAYRLQRWVDGQATYVLWDNWDKDKYVFQYPDKVRKVRAEICEVAPEIIELLLPLAPLKKRK